MAGRTTLSKMVTLFRERPDIITVQVAEDPLGLGLGYVEWEGLYHSGEAQANIQSSSLDEAVVDNVLVQYEVPVTLDQVIAVYGEPSHVFVDASSGEHSEQERSYGVMVVYLPEGFALDYASPSAILPPLMNGTLEFRHIRFFVPSEEGFSQAMDWDMVRGLTTWAGFQSFAFYCTRAYPTEAVQLCPPR